MLNKYTIHNSRATACEFVDNGLGLGAIRLRVALVFCLYVRQSWHADEDKCKHSAAHARYQL